MDPEEVARSLITDRFPDAIAAYLGGSVLTARRTATSDLDIVVVTDGPPAPYRETTAVGEAIAELFVHTVASLRHYWRNDVTSRRPALVRMCAQSAVLVPGRLGRDLRVEAVALLEAGPPPLTDAEWDARRYGITEMLDDLVGPAQPREVAFIANQLVVAVAEAALLAAGHWIGNGKWLSRELRDLDEELLNRLLQAHEEAIHGEVDHLVAVSDAVLVKLGGRLMAGYRAQGSLPNGK